MEKRIIYILCGFFLLLIGASCHKQKLTIAVAANMQYAIQAIIEEYQKTDNTEINVVLGASGNLTQQIMQGAPFDIFVSADDVFPQKLFQEGLTLTKPRVYAHGVLVLWTAKEGLNVDKGLQVLLSRQVQSIAIANPKVAPYGSAAEFILKKYNLYNLVASKFVTGESITQVSHFIATRAADIGFTAKAMVVNNILSGHGKWIALNESDYPAIKQSAALLNYSDRHHHNEADKFYQFLFSDKAKEIYKKFGYIVE